MSTCFRKSDGQSMISFFQNIKYTFLSFLSILVCHNLNNYFITGISCFGYYVGYACNCCSAEACINLLLQLYHYDDYVSSSVILIPIIANPLFSNLENSLAKHNIQCVKRLIPGISLIWTSDLAHFTPQ